MIILNKELIITDRLAISIRRLWHIESIEEKKKIIKHYDYLYRIFILVKNHPELFKPDELEKWEQKREALTESEKDLISEIFVALHMGVISDPLEYTIEEVHDFYSKGLFLTKEELEEMIEWQFCGAKEHNPELFILLGEYLEKHLYFETVEEAEKVWEEYDASHKKETHRTPTTYLSTDLSKTVSSRSFCSTSPSTISLS